MKDIRKKTAEMIAESSSGLAQFVAHTSFEFWQRKDFRLYVDFDNISQTEQDRIFNELEVSILGLYELHLNQALENAKEEKQVFLSAIKKDLPKAFIQVMVDAGVDRKLADQWQILMDLRFKEYKEHLKLTLKESLKMQEFKGKDADLRPTWARIETITIDCLTHIRRGKVEENDPLWKLLRKWIIMTDAILNTITHPK